MRSASDPAEVVDTCSSLPEWLVRVWERCSIQED